MIETFVEVLGGVLLAAGAFFYLVGAIGLLRMPDVFTRMHASGISDTVGAGAMIAGLMMTAGFTLISAKLAIILLTILFTSPIATHALAQAAMHANVKPVLKSRRVLGVSAARAPLIPAPSASKSSATRTQRKRPQRRRAKAVKQKGAVR